MSKPTLTLADVIESVGLVSAQTDARIVDIISVGEGAIITTGDVVARNVGSGQTFKCERTETGWRIEDAGDWIC